MYEREIYVDICPKGGRVQPSRCGSCLHVDGGETIRLLNKSDGRAIVCKKQSKVDELMERGKTKEQAEKAYLAGLGGEE